MMGYFILMILVLAPGVWSGDWWLSLESQCALKGTSVVIKCDYYPFGYTVTEVHWLKRSVASQLKPVPLSDLPSPPDFEYVGNIRGDCDLKINNVRPMDEGRYYFSFVTTRDTWSSRYPAYLTVRELTAIVKPTTVSEGYNVRLICESGCPSRIGIVWFRDGQRVSEPEFWARREDAGTYQCAVYGQENARSASVALNVHYAPKNVTLSISSPADIVRGSSVTFSCSCEANPPVTHKGYSLYKDGQWVSLGQTHTIIDMQPSHSGLYHCQARNNISWMGIYMVKSTEIHLDVQYAPKKVTLSISSPANIIRGSSVTFSCSCEANPPVTREGYSLYKDGQLVSLGQTHTIFDMQPSHSGLYHCRARNSISWMGIDTVKSTEIHLDVQHEPMKVSGSVEPQQVAEGGSVNLTCSSVANPAADNYTWYRRRTHSANSNSILQVGSGQMLSLHSVEASHSGLYFCQARNSVGENNSTEVLLTVETMNQGSQSHLIIAGLIVMVALVTALLLFWKKLRAQNAVSGSRVNGLSSSVREDQLDTIYANITVPSAPPLTPSSDEADVIYSTVTIKHKATNVTPHIKSKAEAEEENSVIYAAVAKSRGS
ncbi:B-cell receptor CD22-like isoform X1 [Solea solea]|uniref:B-cell receptor CD22-like isoform X1 n=2 Tax=Solea solea TaxID=90069 RepID=UPI00272AA5DD|nr:B-cell receptor CD22-like isoform X1 [Solea solea]